MSLPRPKTYPLLFLRLSRKELELGLSLLYQIGVVTLEEKRCGPMIELRAQIPSGKSPEKLLKSLRQREHSIFSREIFPEKKIVYFKNDSWTKEYQKHLKPFILPTPPKIEELSPITVDPSGKVPKKLKENTLYIHSGLAFGTGTHPSTQLACFLMERIIKKNRIKKVLDLGCGTGILAMVCKKRKVEEVYAVDRNSEAIKVSRENFRSNQLRGIHLQKDLYSLRKKFDLIVSNIVSETLKELFRPILSRMAKNGYLILSGLLYRDCDEIIKTYRKLQFLERTNKKGWSALLFQNV